MTYKLAEHVITWHLRMILGVRYTYTRGVGHEIKENAMSFHVGQ